MYPTQSTYTIYTNMLVIFSSKVNFYEKIAIRQIHRKDIVSLKFNKIIFGDTTIL